MKLWAWCVLAAAGVIVLSRVQAGERTSIQGLGMARTYMGVARGLDAVGINPASLDADSATVSLAILPFGAHVGSDFLTYDLYTRYFTGVESDGGRIGRHLTDVDKQAILAAFPNGVGRIEGDVEAMPLGLAIHTGIGTIAFSVTEQAAAMISLPSEYARFLLYGNAPGSVYDFSATSVSAWWTREYAVSLATTLRDVWGLQSLSIGLSGKLIHGYGYAELTRFNSRLETGTDGILHGVVDMRSRAAGIDPLAGQGGGYTPFADPAGSGFGVDLGLAAQINPVISVGLSVTDIGSLTWTKNIREVRAESTLVVDNPLDQVQRDGVERALRGEAQPGQAFSTPLPTTIRAGVAFELNRVKAIRSLILGEMTVACDIHQVLQEAPGSPAGTRLAFGMEWRPWGFLPLRTGYSWGGPDHRNFALGLGFHLGFFEMDFASENLGWIFSPDTFSYGSVSAGMKMRF